MQTNDFLTNHSAIHSVLDGFRLMNKSKVRNPSDVYRVDLSGQHLDKVVEKDLLLFVNLYSLIANENRLNLLDLSFLPQLKELRIVQNQIKVLPPQVAFQMPLLEMLDISFNYLKPESLTVLAALPNLQYLDVSFCGLTHVPEDISNMNHWWSTFDDIDKSMVLPGFLKLKTLNLSNNKLTNAEALMEVLKHMPSLSKLELQNNHLTSLTSLQTTDPSQTNQIQKTNGFFSLEYLDISSNDISTAEGIMGLVFLPKLTTARISNNPITLKNGVQIEINDIENGECLGYIDFNPYIILQDSYGINVLDALKTHRKKTAKKPGHPFSVNEITGSDRMNNLKKLSIRDEDISMMLNKKFEASLSTVADEEVEPSFDDSVSLISSTLSDIIESEYFPLNENFIMDETFITGVPILEGSRRDSEVLQQIRSDTKAQIPSIHFDSKTFFDEDVVDHYLPKTILGSVKALRYALSRCHV